MTNTLLTSLFFIFTGAAILSTFALYTRQSLLVAYMLLGTLLGPWGLKWVNDSSMIEQVGNIGILFLLFLLGLQLQPQKIFRVFKNVSWLVGLSSILFLAVGFTIAYSFHFSKIESLVVGVAAMFSSTIIGLKLLPTTVLHHQHTGEIMIAILLLQDLMAIFVLLVMHGSTFGSFNWETALFVILMLPGLLLFAFLSERYILRMLFRKFDRIREYAFLLSIAWCLSLSVLANGFGLSDQVGAFVAGISIASSPIALYIAESLKPVRDFFLVLSFFAMGASFNIDFFEKVAIPAALLSAAMLLAKPIVYRFLFLKIGEPKHLAWETGIRLAQMSEFSILLAYVGIHEKILSNAASNLIQLATMLTFIVSSYWVILYYPTPVALSDKLRRD